MNNKLRDFIIISDDETFNALCDQEEDVLRLDYDVEQNTLIDECGYDVPNIFDFITPNDLFLFKNRKDDMVVHSQKGQRVELYYPDNWEVSE